jgi:hypothetical protein
MTDMKTNGIQDPEIKPHNYNHQIFDKGAKDEETGEKTLLQQMVLGKLAI